MASLKYLTLAVLLSAHTSIAGAMDLLRTYEMALERDPAFHAAEANRNAILQTKPIAIAQLLPNVSFRGRMNRNHLLVKSTPIVLQRGQDVFYWDNVMDVNLTQPIYRHELWVQLSQADNQVAAAEAQYAAAEQDVTANCIVKAWQKIHKSRLAPAGRPDKRNDPAFWDDYINMA